MTTGSPGDPFGGPDLMPVWAIWREDRLWFSSAKGSRKVLNLAGEPRCTLSTEDPLEPIVVQGRARQITDRGALETMLAAENAKYGTDYGLVWSTHPPAASLRKLPSGYLHWIRLTSRAHQRVHVRTEDGLNDVRARPSSPSPGLAAQRGISHQIHRGQMFNRRQPAGARSRH